MATSADYLRLASNASRALADTALDQLSHAVLVVDVRHRQLPVVLTSSTTTSTADTLFLVDTALRVRFINRGVQGLSIEQIIGGDVAVLLPESARS